MAPDFDSWRTEFEETNTNSFASLDRTLTEFMGMTEEDCALLRLNFSKACFDAVNFQSVKSVSRKKLTEERNAVIDIDETEGRSPLKAINEILKFCKQHNDAAKRIAEYWLPEAYGNHPNLPKRLQGKTALETLKINLNKLDWAFKLYQKKHSEFPFYPIQEGPLVFPQIKEKQRTRLRDNPAEDGLIFELYLLIRCFINNLRLDPINRPMELPKGPKTKSPNGTNELIAQFVKAALGKEYSEEQIAARLDSLKKDNAKWVGWEHYRTS